MSIPTFLKKWRHNRASYGQHSNHLRKKKSSNKKINENEHKDKEM
jgi:hypothetical protein